MLEVVYPLSSDLVARDLRAMDGNIQVLRDQIVLYAGILLIHIVFGLVCFSSRHPLWLGCLTGSFMWAYFIFRDARTLRRTIRQRSDAIEVYYELLRRERHAREVREYERRANALRLDNHRSR